jgi:hypothetical protein
MLMAAVIASEMQDAMVDALNTHLAGAAVLQGWTGSVPNSLSDGDTGTKVAELACSNPVFADQVGGLSAANAIADDDDCVAGTVTYWRLKNGSGDALIQMSEGVDIITDNPVFNDGDTAHVDSLEMTLTVGPPDHF